MANGFKLKPLYEEKLFQTPLDPYVFGVDPQIPEAAGLPPVPPNGPEGELPQTALAPVTTPPPPIKYPKPPQYEEMPTGVPKSLWKSILLIAAGAAPGFNEGYWGQVGERRKETAARNKSAFDIFREQMDLAKAQELEGGRMERADLTSQLNYERLARQREADAVKAEAGRQLMALRQEQADQKSAADLARQQKEFLDYQNRLRFFDESYAPDMKKRGKTDQEIGAARDQFILKTGGDPLQKKIDTAEAALGRALKEGEILNMAGATRAPAGGMYPQVEMKAIAGAGTVEERLAQVPPEFRPLVQATGEYRRVPVGGFATRDPFWKQVLDYTFQVYPEMDEKEFPQRQRMMNSFTSGQDAKELEAINTVTNHVGTLMEAVQALQNGNVQRLNNIALQLKTEVGQTPRTTFETIVRRIGPEVTRAYVGTGGEFGERKANEGDFKASYSPQQLYSNGRVTLQLLGGKIDSKRVKWTTGMNRKTFSLREGGPSFITPAAQAAIAKWGPKEGTGGQTGGPETRVVNGVTYEKGADGLWHKK